MMLKIILLFTIVMLTPLGIYPVQAKTTKQSPKVAPAEPEADTPKKLRQLVDGLDQESLQQAFRILREEYIKHGDLDYLEINRSALQGMLDRLDFGAMLLTEKSRSARNSPYLFHDVAIGTESAYLRFGRYNKDEIARLDQAIKKYNSIKSVRTLIVDLRSPQAQADFAIAANILGRFRPPNELLFKIRRPGNDRPTLFISKPAPANWQKDLILLVDHETGNVAEIIAAVLKRDLNCLIIGEQTPGLTVEYRDIPVGKDRILRYAIAEVVLEDDSSIFQKGITPDIPTVTSAKVKQAIYRDIDTGKKLRDFLFQKQRPRLNEAALVAGTDPEMGYYLLRSQQKQTQWDKPPLQDRVLQQAVDLLNVSSFWDGKKK